MNRRNEIMNNAARIRKGNVPAYDDVIDAGLAMMLAAECNTPMPQAAAFVARLGEMMMNSDEARFSLYDYVDAFINSTKSLDMTKLMALDDQEFFMVMAASAEKKRKTYSYDAITLSGKPMVEKLIDSVLAGPGPQYRRVCVTRCGYAVVPGATDEEATENAMELRESDYDWKPVNSELPVEVVEACGPDGSV